jgi:hypothetical protein
MNHSIKIAVVAVIALVGAAACTNGSTQKPDAAPAPVIASTTTTTTTTSASSAPEQPATVVTEVVTMTVTREPAPPAFVQKVDSRPGYGKLKLGMTLEEARETGLVGTIPDFDDNANSCVMNSVVAVSKKYGVERITLPASARTSTGIGVGTTYSAVKKAHPDAVEYRHGYTARMAGFILNFQSRNDAFMPYRDTDTVAKIKLISSDLDCPNAAL